MAPLGQVDLWLAILGGVALVLALSSGVMKRHGWLPTAPIVAVGVGIVLGPAGLQLLSLAPLRDRFFLLEQLARLTIAFAVTSIALRLEPQYYRKRIRTLAVILGPGMLAMWLLSSFVVYLVLALDPLLALLIGAILTPTDPVLANSIVTGDTAVENIPQRLRNVLSGEAGFNDGTAYALVFLPIFLLSAPVGSATAEWVTRTVLWEVLGGVLLGASIGTIAGMTERWERARLFLEETSVLTITVALTVLVLGVAKLIGLNDILAVFIAGILFNWRANPQDEAREQQVEEVFNRLFTIPVFVVFGMMLPWSQWVDLGWRALAVVGGILVFRRLPMVIGLRRAMPPLDRPAAALFVGWFGPIGIAAVYYAVLAMERTGSEMVWTVGSLLVASSVLIHGITATPGAHAYAKFTDNGDMQ